MNTTNLVSHSRIESAIGRAGEHIEYGTPYYSINDTYMHVKGKTAVFTHSGRPFYEYDTDTQEHSLVFTRHHYAAITNRMVQAFYQQYKIRVRQAGRAGEDIFYSVDVTSEKSGRVWPLKKVSGRVKVILDSMGGILDLIPERAVTLRTDKIDELKAVYKKLSRAEKILIAQIRMNGYADLENTSTFGNPSETTLRMNEAFRKKYSYYVSDRHTSAAAELITDTLYAWMDTDNPQPLREFVAWAARTFSPEQVDKTPNQQLIQAVKLAIKHVRTVARARLSVIIETSNSDLTQSYDKHNQNGVVQPTDGLRGVQVPSEAEVC